MTIRAGPTWLGESGSIQASTVIASVSVTASMILVAAPADAMIVARSLEAGATGYLLKDTSSEQLVKAVQQVANGVPYLDGELAVKVALAGSRVVRRNPLSDLTPRELQVLALLADGKPYNRIADELNVSYKTVVNVSSQLKQKLEARNLPELVSTAVKLLAAPS